jgi:O-acetyl-ADP-ribose deacetylase (regulator of RNase III)
MDTDADMFSSSASAWINTINCKGVMGGGIALEFKKRFPLMFLDYKNKCNVNLLKPGRVYTYINDTVDKGPLIILNVATKDDFRDPSKLEWVEDAIVSLTTTVQYYSIGSVALPALGCGLGGLNFKDVEALYRKYLTDSECNFEVYQPR